MALSRSFMMKNITKALTRRAKIAEKISGAKEAVGNYIAARKGEKIARENTDKLGIQIAKKKYPDMTPSKLRLEYEGGRPTAETRDYEKIKKNVAAEYRKRFNIK